MKRVNFYFYNIIFFLFFFILSRFLFPYSDEPDLTLKSIFYLEFLNHYFDSYLHPELFVTYNISNNCGIQSSTLSLWASVNQMFCNPPFKIFMVNFITTILFSLPTFLLIYILFIDENISILKKLSSENLSNSVLLTFLYGSFIYFLGLFSPEKISLILSISFFLIINNFYLCSILLLVLFQLDIGSFLFLFSFYFIYLSITFLNNYFNLKKIIFLIIFSIVFLLIFKNYFFLYIFEANIFSFKYNFIIEGMAGVNKDNDFTIAMEKYPLILRVIHSTMSFIFLSAQEIKVPLLYLLNFYVFILILYKSFLRQDLINLSIENTKSFYMLISAMTVISYFFILFPLNTNGKNLIFLLPVFINFAMIYYDKYKIFYFMLINNLILFYFLTLYRI